MPKNPESRRLKKPKISEKSRIHEKKIPKFQKIPIFQKIQKLKKSRINEKKFRIQEIKKSRDQNQKKIGKKIGSLDFQNLRLRDFRIPPIAIPGISNFRISGIFRSGCFFLVFSNPHHYLGDTPVIRGPIMGLWSQSKGSNRPDSSRHKFSPLETQLTGVPI